MWYSGIRRFNNLVSSVFKRASWFERIFVEKRRAKIISYTTVFCIGRKNNATEYFFFSVFRSPQITRTRLQTTNSVFNNNIVNRKYHKPMVYYHGYLAYTVYIFIYSASVWLIIFSRVLKLEGWCILCMVCCVYVYSCIFLHLIFPITPGCHGVHCANTPSHNKYHQQFWKNADSGSIRTFKMYILLLYTL